MHVIADYDSTNGSWQPLITWLDGVIMLMRLNVPNILKMMVFDHVDNFEWLNILTIGNYFVGEIHGPWGHAAVLTNGEPTAEKIVYQPPSYHTSWRWIFLIFGQKLDIDKINVTAEPDFP